MNMQHGASGNYYGNTLIHDASFIATHDWQCIELHVRMNPDMGSNAGAELGTRGVIEVNPNSGV